MEANMEKTAKRIAPFIIALMVLVAFFGAMNFGSVSFAAGETG